MARIFLESTDTSFTLNNSNSAVYGAIGNQGVVITNGVTGVTLDSNIENLQFSGATTDYKYVQVGTALNIYNAAGNLVASDGVQDNGTTGTLLTFSNGTVQAKLAPSSNGVGMTVGGQAVTAVATPTTLATTTPVTVTIPAANINTAIFSVSQPTSSATIPTFSVTGQDSVTEGSNALFTVLLDNPATTPVTVSYTISNVGKTTTTDYSRETITGLKVKAVSDLTTTTGTITFSPGATSALISLPILYDNDNTSGEGVTVSLSNPTMGILSPIASSATTSIVEPTVLAFGMSSNAVAGVPTQEGRTIKFTVSPSDIVNVPTTLNLSIVGKALGTITSTTQPTDFLSIKPITFAAGATGSQTITVTVKDNGAVDGLRAYDAQLMDSNFKVISDIAGTITDPVTTVTLSAGATNFNEGTTLTLTATADTPAPAGGLTIPYTLSTGANTGTATIGLDYYAGASTNALITGNIVIAPGATTGTLVLNAVADNITEGTETVSVALAAVNGVNVVTTPVQLKINDTSLGLPVLPANSMVLTQSATTIDETSPNNTVTYTVTVGSAPTVALSIPYTLSGSDLPVTNFTGSSPTGTISILAGSTTGKLTLTTVANNLTDGTKNIVLTLGTLPTGYVLATGTQKVLTTTVNDTSTSPSVNAYTLTSTSDKTTNGIDNISGATYNVINGFIDGSTGAAGSTSTWNLTDSIAPTAGATMNVTALNAGSNTTLTLAGYSTTGVSTFNLKVIDSLSTTSNTTSLDTAAMTGLTAFNVANSSTVGTTNPDTVSLTSLSAATALGVNSNGQYTNVTANWVPTAIAGTNDTVNLAFAGRSGIVTIGSGFENAVISTSGTGVREKGLVGTTFKTVTVSGTELRIDNTLDLTMTSFDASNATGAINVAMTPGSTFSAKGGAGTADTINLFAAGSLPTITGFETLVADAAVTYDLTNVTAATTLGVAVNAGNVAFTNAAATQNTLAFSGNFNTQRSTNATSTTGNLTTNGTVNWTLKSATSTTDKLNITVDNGGNTNTGTYTVGNLTATAENMTFKAADWSNVTFGNIIQTATAGSASTFKATAAASNLTFGTLTAAAASGGSTYDFSAVNSVAPTATVTTPVAVTVTTGNTTNNLTYIGSSGIDIVTNTAQTSTGSTNTQTFNLGAGNDRMTINMGGSAAASVTDKLVVNGEAGDDTFIVPTASAARKAGTVTIDGGAGTDTLQITGSATKGAVATIANIENITFLNSTDAITDLTVAAGYTDAVTVTDVSGKNQTLKLTSTGSIDLSNWKWLGWTSGTDPLSITGSGTIKAPASAISTSITGGTGADTITGSSAADTITGGKGADLITGGIGATTLTQAASGDSGTWTTPSTNTISTVGFDVLTDAKAADVVKLATYTNAATGALSANKIATASGVQTPVTTDNGVVVADNGVEIITGHYDSTAKTFVGAAKGAGNIDALVIYDGNSATPATNQEAIVLVGCGASATYTLAGNATGATITIG